MRTPSCLRSILPSVLLAAALAACDAPANPAPRVPARVDVVAGDAQSAPAGAELPGPLVVRVVDARGRPVSGQIVNFRVTSGGGSVFAGSAISDRDGVARERWTLGTVAADSQTVEARAVDAAGEARVFAVFRADALPAAPAALHPVGTAAKTGFAGEAVTDSPAARVVDAYGNPVPGVAVAWSAGGGGAVSAATAETGPDGVSRVGWSLPPRVGPGSTATASAGALGSASFTAAAALPPTAVLERVTPDTGTARTGEAEPRTRLAVRITLRDGRPLQGAAVRWTGTYSADTVPTDTAGVSAHVPRFSALGTHRVTAAADGLAPVAFTLRVLPGPPFRLEGEVVDPDVWYPELFGVGELVPSYMVAVTLLDAAFNPVAGEPVTFTVVMGGGTLDHGQVLTDSLGVAYPHWWLGPGKGTHALVASHPGAHQTVRYDVTASVTGPAVRVEVSPDTLRLAPGQTGRIEVEAYDIAGNRVPDHYPATARSTHWTWSATGPVTLECARDAFMGNPNPNYCIVTATAAGTARVTARNGYKFSRATGTAVVIIQ